MSIDEAIVTLVRDGDRLLQLVRLALSVIGAWDGATHADRQELRRLLGRETELHIALLAARERARRSLAEDVDT